MSTTALRRLSDLVDRLAADGQMPEAVRAALAAAAVGREVTAPVTADSRRVATGGVFVAIPGFKRDGAEFAAAAAAAGATAIVAERDLRLGVPTLVVRSARRALAIAATWWEGDPAESLIVVGVTGTDGKTTTATFLSTALSACGIRTGLISTAISRIGGVQHPAAAHQTTPEAPELQAQLRAVAAAGDAAVVLETTSHGLELERVGGIAYAAAVITTFSPDHLDLHGSVEAYRAAKLRLLERVAGSAASRAAGLPPVAVIRTSDAEMAPFAAAAARAGLRIVSYDATVADELVVEGVRYPVTLAMPGVINARNAAAALALVVAWGLPVQPALDALAAEPGPPGRSEQVRAGQPFAVIVDFAHTGPSLAAALGLARGLCAPGGRVLLVTGAAGERDPGRRTAIGSASVAADRVWVADEDPRHEDPAEIAATILAARIAAGGAPGDATALHDRRAAIAAAIDAARAGDVVLLAGKGHERTIERRGIDEPWDEVAAAREALASLGYPHGQ